jgi:PAS domain S-box-containing protein
LYRFWQGKNIPVIKELKTQRTTDTLTQQIDSMYWRLTALYEAAQNQDLPAGFPLFLTETLKELGTATEVLQVACEELRQQNEVLAEAQSQLQVERQRYQDLFELAPEAYFVTNGEGIIQEANQMAAHLLQVPQQFLVGKSLVNYVSETERRRFRVLLLQLSQTQQQVQEQRFLFQPRSSQSLPVGITVTVSAPCRGELSLFRWLVRDLTERQRAEVALLQSDFGGPSPAQILQTYHRGEMIPLDGQTLWLVAQGVVKLSTFVEGSEEVLVGLAGPAAVFGASLTNLPTYQAIALSEVRLQGLSMAEIAASPPLVQALLPRMSQRLRQTESLLALTGRRHVKDRLHQLLLLLKQEVGHATPQGTQIDVRLTHEELASACCTTRVTITRLLSDWRQQGLVGLSCDRHLVLNDEYF